MVTLRESAVALWAAALLVIALAVNGKPLLASLTLWIGKCGIAPGPAAGLALVLGVLVGSPAWDPVRLSLGLFRKPAEA